MYYAAEAIVLIHVRYYLALDKQSAESRIEYSLLPRTDPG